MAHWIDQPPLARVNVKNVPVVRCSNCGLDFCDLINNHYFIYWHCPFCGEQMKFNSEEYYELG